ncbi:hypothetical protein T484DRAFT_1930875 [Baffinella frigidus]|nr:hypothetical protein T484DRAFT_1930875 [Cryptophyta sp. CCMP2293]
MGDDLRSDDAAQALTKWLAAFASGPLLSSVRQDFASRAHRALSTQDAWTSMAEPPPAVAREDAALGRAPLFLAALHVDGMLEELLGLAGASGGLAGVAGEVAGTILTAFAEAGFAELRDAIKNSPVETVLGRKALVKIIDKDPVLQLLSGDGTARGGWGEGIGEEELEAFFNLQYLRVDSVLLAPEPPPTGVVSGVFGKVASADFSVSLLQRVAGLRQSLEWLRMRQRARRAEVGRHGVCVLASLAEPCDQSTASLGAASGDGWGGKGWRGGAGAGHEGAVVGEALRASGMVSDEGVCSVDAKVAAAFWEGAAEGEGLVADGSKEALRALGLTVRWGLGTRARHLGTTTLLGERASRSQRAGGEAARQSQELLKAIARCDTALLQTLPPAVACVAMAHVPREMLAVLLEAPCAATSARDASGRPSHPDPAALQALEETVAALARRFERLASLTPLASVLGTREAGARARRIVPLLAARGDAPTLASLVEASPHRFALNDLLPLLAGCDEQARQAASRRMAAAGARPVTNPRHSLLT